MLKINLLPAYIFERRQVRQAAFIFGLLFLMIVAGFVGWWIMLGRQHEKLVADVADMENKRNYVNALDALAKAEAARIGPVKQKLDFINAVLDYNDRLPKIYEELAKYTYGRILYRSVQLSRDTVTIQAHARSIGDCGRYLLNMYRATKLFSSVSISAVPGYPAGDTSRGPAAGFDFTVTCRLVEPLNPPAYGGGAAAAGGEPGVAPVGGAPGGAAPAPAPAPSDMGAPTAEQIQQMEQPPPGWGEGGGGGGGE